MEKYGVVTSPAPSLSTVGRDIAHVFQKLGHQVTFSTRQIYAFEAERLFNRAVVFITFDPLYAPSWFLLSRDYNKAGIHSVIYTTTEGLPKKWHIPFWIRRDCLFIACSPFVENMLREIDMNVIGMIRHGVNFDQINHAVPKKKELKRRLNTKVVFGTVASSHRRKGLEFLKSAIKDVSERIPDAKFYVHTNPRGKSVFEGLRNVHVSTNFGRLSRKEILSLIASFDFYICSSLCEGFGLPLLEAQALGVPCIFPCYSPLNEVTHLFSNFPFRYEYTEKHDLGDGILYECHFYSPEEMAKKIEKAYEVYTCNPEEYQQRIEAIKRWAKRFDIMQLYPEFIKVLE